MKDFAVDSVYPLPERNLSVTKSYKVHSSKPITKYTKEKDLTRIYKHLGLYHYHLLNKHTCEINQDGIYLSDLKIPALKISKFKTESCDLENSLIKLENSTRIYICIFMIQSSIKRFTTRVNTQKLLEEYIKKTPIPDSFRDEEETVDLDLDEDEVKRHISIQCRMKIKVKLEVKAKRAFKIVMKTKKKNLMKKNTLL